MIAGRFDSHNKKAVIATNLELPSLKGKVSSRLAKEFINRE